MTALESDRQFGLEQQVRVAQRRMGNLGIFTTLRRLEPFILAQHGSFRDKRHPIRPVFLGSAVAVGITAGKVVDRHNLVDPLIRLSASFNLHDKSITVCGVTKPSLEWRRKEVQELMYKEAHLTEDPSGHTICVAYPNQVRV